MAKKKFWKYFFAGIAAIAALVGTVDIVINWGGRPKPQILDAQNCFIEVSANTETVWFELLVNNAGAKSCSITSIDLFWPDGHKADLEYEPSTPLPKTISAGLTERIVAYGFCHKMHGFTPEHRIELQPDQNSVEAEAVAKFNTGQSVKKSIPFAVRRPN
ncbi:MAG: hypothetical protein PHQ35_02910 [Phycisphaerae bacterium]|nr:hypothetical protein [Phycisphaerae bacterium]MDD5380757.1 hypothetical protein [Phycisphaerae bacterium]